MRNVLVAGGFALLALNAQSAFLNFDSLDAVSQYDGVPTNPAAVLTDDFISEGILFGRTGVSAGVVVNTVFDNFVSPRNAVSGLDAGGLIPYASSGDIYFSFTVPGTTTPSVTDSVSFYIGDSGGDLDIFEVRSYDLSNNLVDIQNLSGNSFFQVSIADPLIHRVVVDFDDRSFAGYTLDDLRFAAPQGGRVPDGGATGLLLIGSVLGMGACARRMRLQ